MQRIKFPIFQSRLFKRCLLKRFVIGVLCSYFPENTKFSDCFILLLVIFIIDILSNHLAEQ